MFNIVLLNPEIPQNTGNIIRLAANTGARLHLAGKRGFALDDAKMRRAGLDYREFAEVRAHDSLADAFAAAGKGRRFAATGGGETRFDKPQYRAGDIFVFGCESKGLPKETLAEFPPENRIYIPLRPHNRSMNLSNAAAVVIMEAWRQIGFLGEGKAG